MHRLEATGDEAPVFGAVIAAAVRTACDYDGDDGGVEAFSVGMLGDGDRAIGSIGVQKLFTVQQFCSRTDIRDEETQKKTQTHSHPHSNGYACMLLLLRLNMFTVYV